MKSGSQKMMISLLSKVSGERYKYVEREYGFYIISLSYCINEVTILE